jgi:hypothetical protein
MTKRAPNCRPLPRQIIVRLLDKDIKRRILKSSKNLNNSEEFSNVTINEDLIKTRNTIAYRARQLKKAGFLSQTWTVDGKILMKDKSDRITIVTSDYAFKKHIMGNFPEAISIAYPPPTDSDDSSKSTVSNSPTSYAEALATNN